MTTHEENALLNMDRATLQKWVNKADGWTIWDAGALRDDGFPAAFVDKVTRTYQSDGSPKGTIYTAGEPVKELTGVYALAFLYAVCRELGVESNAPAIGRGFQARQVQQSLNAWFKAQ